MMKGATMAEISPVWQGFGLTSAQWYGLAALSNRLQGKGIRTTGVLPVGVKQGVEVLFEGSGGKAFSLCLAPKGELLLTAFASMDHAKCQGLFKGYNLEEMGRRMVWLNVA
jgi:hypothetical protein